MPTTPQPDRLVRAVADNAVRDRYFAKIHERRDGECWLWTGAISDRGHGRFWVADRYVVIAHRYGYALHHGVEDLPPLLGHRCDNPICQNPHEGHLGPSTSALNRNEWAQRRLTLGSPIRDQRGALGRALALREAALHGGDIHSAARAGLGPLDLLQEPLWHSPGNDDNEGEHA